MMKKILLTLISVLVYALSTVKAQDSNVLIGLAGPAYGVTIKTNFPSGSGGWARGFKISNQDNSIPFVMLGAYGSYANGVTSLIYSYVGPSYGSAYMVFRPNGNVGIGTNSPQAKLSVNGNILAKEIKVKTNISVPDYVFDADYKMRPLAEVERYVQEHKHLPEIPSAKEIGEKGLDLAEMNLLLLKNVEELTLRLIEKEKQVSSIHDQLLSLSKEIKELKHEITDK